MAIISQLNTTIDDHTKGANILALAILATMISITAAAINQAGSLTKASYDTLVLSTPAVQQTTVETKAKVQAVPKTTATGIALGNALPLTIQSQQPNIIGSLQPAQGVTYNTQASATTLQPAAADMQLTGANPQNAAGIQ